MENLINLADYHQKDLVYDYTFIGLGAANSLLLIELLKHPEFSNKKIAVIDSSHKTNNDKTYCFWAEPNAPIIKDLTAIISRSYSMLSINNAPARNIGKQCYFYIRSLDLYQYTETLIQSFTIDRHFQKVNTIHTEGNLSIIQTDEGSIHSQYIFDSRTPSYPPTEEKDVYLEQSFFGMYVKCEQTVFNVKAFDMMNFDVDQDAYTQFVYVLPFSENEALVELTRFGKDKIEEQYARKILDEKILKDYGPYTLKGVETGSIPMTTQRIPASDNPCVLNTGARANMIKPSTGYAFKNMYEFAKMTTQKILGNQLQNFNSIHLKTKKRFRFYDTLLLIILQRWPDQGKKIFSRLFSKQSTHTILQFLDGKTAYRNEIAIFYSLNWAPFLRALVIYCKQQIALRYWLVILVTILYHLLQVYDSSLALNYSYLVIIIGFIVVGLPHGAVDHLLYLRNNPVSLKNFLGKYLGIVILGLALWLLAPSLSLIIFILYSSFHFGESEFEKDEKTISTFSDHISAFVLGLSILTCIIFSHPLESASIIAQLGTTFPTNTFTQEAINGAYWIALSSFLLILLQLKLSGKSVFSGLPLVLLAGIQTPLVLAFSLYFIFQHSCNAWKHICNGINLNSLSLYKKALPYLLGSIAILILILLMDFQNLYDSDSVIASGFMFISCISFPHFVVMHLFYQSIQKK
jgi:lycopene beta-cyclase